MRIQTETMTRSLSKRIKHALRADPRARGLQRPRDSAVVDPGTGGHCTAIVEFAPGIDVELWLDRYAGLDTPRVWAGFRSASRSKIRRMTNLALRAGLNEVRIRRSTRDMQKKKGIWQFRRPLSTDQFDVQILESYGSEFYLGVFMPYPWPLSPRNQRAVVSDSTNYVGSLAAAWQSLRPRGNRTVGPWNRPDRVAEARAIRFVRAKLRRKGYKVRSRESEVCGYDLHAIRNDRELHVEVNGTCGDQPRFFLTRSERRKAESDADWRLAIVTHAKTNPHLRPLVLGKQLTRRFQLEPIQWIGTTRSPNVAGVRCV
jgi:uncharacterized protein DUF3883